MTPAIRQRLAAGEQLVMLDPGGYAPSLPARLPEGVADILFVDCERAPVSVDQAAVMAQAARAAGLLPVIRSESGDPAILTRYLDAGAGGLVLPLVRQAADVERLLAVIAGHRADALAIPQIETREAAAATGRFAAMEGVDAWLIGPNDLAAEMGHPGRPDHPEVLAEVTRIAATLRAADRAFGLPATSPAALEHWWGQGAQLIYLPLSALVAQGAEAFFGGG